ncbi:MAG: LacI family transcriptional regulator, partial [Lentisphaerae bacterium]
MATRFQRNRTGKKRVSMREISRIAGVNQSTVSRILNGTSGKYKYAEETVRRVKEIAKSLGYRPNRLVHGVFTGKTFAIGVIVPPSDFYRRILQGIHDKLLEKHYACILGWNRHNIEEQGNSNQEELIQQMLEHRVEGIILRPTIDDASDQEFLSVHNAGVPIVAVDREIPYVKADFVGSDDLEGGKQALQYLVEKGHTRIIHVATPMSISSISHRRQGFLDAAVNYECSIQTVPCNHKKVEERLAPILARIEPPVAVFCEISIHLTKD